MLILFMVFLFVIFFVYISSCTYNYIRHRRIHKVLLRFMTSCMILFTFTIVFYDDVFFIGTSGGNGGISVKDDSKVFLNSFDNETEDSKENYNNTNEQEMKITAYFDNAAPQRGSMSNLIITGPTGAKATAICQYKGHGVTYMMDIGTGGLAVIPILIESSAEPGQIVVVDIEVIFEGKHYKTNTVFTPQ